MASGETIQLNQLHRACGQRIRYRQPVSRQMFPGIAVPLGRPTD